MDATRVPPHSNYRTATMKFLLVLSALCVAAFGNPVPKPDGRIVGGQLVEIEDYPYQVSLRIFDIHMCGGSILDERTVLTATHCVLELNSDSISVRVGNTANDAGESIKVSKIIEHSNYNEKNADNDMAILKLASPLKFSKTIQPIELQSKGVEVPAGTEAWVSGWGSSSEGAEDESKYLKAVDVAVMTNDECASKFSKNRFTDNMLCAQTLGHDSCDGDSGGPLVANGKLIGVVSWGIGCARPKYPGVYAKVSAMHDWIMENK